jgi:predicted glycoside hydrolase/deacetylase ChbG (UPF0249 family)
MSKRIIICADDYGFDADVSAGILDCVDAGMLSAVSCMSLSPHWPAQSRAIGSRQARADFGLHLDVNEFADYATQRSLPGWIAAAYTRQVRSCDARQWVARQLDKFEEHAGIAPRYVDGHQHVHQLPVLREAVLDAISSRYGTNCALRDCRPHHWRGSKAQLIGLLGAAALSRRARRLNLLQNSDFAGVYDFSAATPYGERVGGWLASLDDLGMLMTHPSRIAAKSDAADPIRQARGREYAWWMSDQARQLLVDTQIGLARFSDLRR